MPASTASSTLLASSTPPSPPFSHTCVNATRTPCSSHQLRTKFLSSLVSVTKSFRAITGSTPNLRAFSMCLPKFTTPSLSASTFASPKSALATPPFILSARIVATKTIASGLKPPMRALISMNFSPPKSEPNPHSVTTISASCLAVFVAIIELQP